MAIAVDAMGGDSPLSVQVEAAVKAVNDFGIDVVLVGAFEQIEETLKLHNYDSDKLRIVNSTETVEMNESPASALRQKKHSSIRVAVDLVKAGEAEAVVSAGNTVHQWLPQSLFSNQSKALSVQQLLQSCRLFIVIIPLFFWTQGQTQIANPFTFFSLP